MSEIRKSGRQTAGVEKRGGYSSSSKQVGQLATPPRGPAPGAAKSDSKPSGKK